jgi:hypothetical protein
MSGDSQRGGLNVEEGIHFQWHLYHRGRGDLRIGLFDESGRTLNRVELPPLDASPSYALFGATPAQPGGWEPEQTFARTYWLGRKRYDCHISRKRLGGFVGHDQVRAWVEEDLRRRMDMTRPGPALCGFDIMFRRAEEKHRSENPSYRLLGPP